MTPSSFSVSRLTARRYVVFWIFWLAALFIYLPAFHAGRVFDFPGLVAEYRVLGFWQYLDRSWSGIAGLYHFTQLVTWLGFKAFGVHPGLWHLFYITLQALNGWLLYRLFSGTLHDSGFGRSGAAAFLGALLFVMSPYASEVVVWLPSYHYLQAIALMCGILICVRHLLHQYRPQYFLLAALLFICSIFSLELFFFTPVLTIAMLLWYRYGLRWDAISVRKCWLLVVLPQLLLMALYFFLLYKRYGVFMVRDAGGGVRHYHQYFATPVKNAFRLAVYGRYWPQVLRDAVYQFADRARVLLPAAIVLSLFVWAVWKRSPFTLAFAWCGITLMGTYPLFFSSLFVVQYDRYTYLPSAFTYPLVAMMVVSIRRGWLRKVTAAAFVMCAAALSLYISLLWRKGDAVVSGLLSTHPPVSGRKVIILNSPEIYRGVPMIGASDGHNYNMLAGALMKKAQPLKDTIWEAASFNLDHSYDGAHAEVMNDSTVRVTLNQWGTWWWYSYLGASSYESSYYRVDMKDAGHSYDLILKIPSKEVALWYCTDKRWKVVDMSIRGSEQY